MMEIKEGRNALEFGKQAQDKVLKLFDKFSELDPAGMCNSWFSKSLMNNLSPMQSPKLKKPVRPNDRYIMSGNSQVNSLMFCNL
mmetsp:Transcript_21331/g.18476  ORF Transcript_21331/g.18476 Transcript_21331/m.18476 type:complete len:84 (-) Transcript_21331:81-332(-)